MPKVAIIGTGPSGLAAAKALAEYGIEPVVLEGALNLGGMWAGMGRGAWSSDMRTNLSHYSCAFSDFPWPPGSDVFPVRCEVIGYLTAYAAEFNLLKYIHFGVRVTSVRRIGPHAWQLGMVHNGHAETDVFDHVVMATGFFSVPYTPTFPGLDQFGGEVRHAAQCDSAAANRETFGGKRVLVVGPAFSGTEIAGQIVPYAASVTVSLRRPMWFLPRFVASRPGGTVFPYDLVFFNRSPDNRLFRKPHLFLAELGGDPGTVSPELAFPPDVEPVTDMVITDDFLRHVRGGTIRVKCTATLRFDTQGVIFADGTRCDVDAIVMCTGYTTVLPLLEQSVLTALEFDPDDRLQPTLLHKQVFHPALPGLAFVGHYRGPYFPVMELQSRWIAGILAGEIALPSEQAMQEGIEDERRIRTARPRPQFPHGDFVGLADGLAREVGVLPPMSPDHPLHAYIARGPVIAAHYRLVGPHARPDLAAETIRATPSPLIETALTASPRVTEQQVRGSPAERVMAMLRGHWAIERTVDPGGHFVGTACCTEMPDRRLMHAETGTLHLPNGTALEGSNRYIYALRDDTIDVRFADGANAGAHFVDLAFSPAQDGLWPLQSGGRHQCRLDQYDAILRLETPDRYVMTYVVCGPRKGYVSRSVYTRVTSTRPVMAG
jgi:dimethylaniline monooxygenase (N-oxide forming)